MKSNITANQIVNIMAALDQLGTRKFDCKSCDPKNNAQRNLSGITHYVDDDTLKFHHSRVNTSGALFGGLVFFIGGTDSLDMHNTKRGHRFAAWDVFGNILYRPELEQAAKTEQAARKAFEAFELDLFKHFQIQFASMLANKAKDAATLETIVASLA